MHQIQLFDSAEGYGGGTSEERLHDLRHLSADEKRRFLGGKEVTAEGVKKWVMTRIKISEITFDCCSICTFESVVSFFFFFHGLSSLATQP